MTTRSHQTSGADSAPPRWPRRLLIANRGEIACRIIHTARRLGIETVAVYSAADRRARHVRLADHAEYLGPAPAAQSYLSIPALLAAAAASDADAVHPGYGFLSENAAFAEACSAAGLCFVGPPAAAIRAMGSKSQAKSLLADAGVPLTPGYHGTEQSPQFLLAEANRIGYPLLIKASAGGGGRGIRRVERTEDFLAALAACQREAQASFGDPQVLLEKYILRPRHIEVQVFADQHGGVIHLGERDCSIQRRHQKVLEEAPAPGMTAERRAAMGEAAVAAAARVGYVGAGTVEFIAAPDGTFYFMEMNTRLQVEHPVTEMITGLDLVEWQLRIAAGEPLPLQQHEVALNGHAIEVRLYAEDPSRGFLPAPGGLLHCEFPPVTASVRVDSGVEAGDEITPHYDAMIAKLIVHGGSRAHALAKLQLALRDTFVVGPRTNREFLARLADTRAVREADLDTALIEREDAALFPPSPELPATAVLAAIATRLLAECRMWPPGSSPSSPVSPWEARDGFRLLGQCRRLLRVVGDERHCDAAIEYLPIGWRVTLGAVHELRACPAGGSRLSMLIDGRNAEARCVLDGDTVHVLLGGAQHALRVIDPRLAAASDEQPEGELRSPMPGRVIAVHVTAGSRVRRGAALLAIEAMKMEHVISAPADGIVETLHVAEGAQVAADAELLVFRADTGG